MRWFINIIPLHQVTLRVTLESSGIVEGKEERIVSSRPEMQGKSARIGIGSNQCDQCDQCGPAIIIWFLIDETSLDRAFSRPDDAVRDAGTQRTRRTRWTGLLAVQRLNWIFPLTSTRAFPAWKPFANLLDCSLSSPATDPSRTLLLPLLALEDEVFSPRPPYRALSQIAPSPTPSPTSYPLCFPSMLRSCSAFVSVSLYFSNHFLCFLHRSPIRPKHVSMDALRHFLGLRRTNRFASRVLLRELSVARYDKRERERERERGDERLFPIVFLFR